MADVQSGKVHGQPTNSTKDDVRDALGLAPDVPGTVPAVKERTPPFHVHDRRVEVSQWVMREVLRNALGESFTYELVPMAVPTNGAMNVGYMLAMFTRSGLVGTDSPYITITSKPFEFTMPEEGVQEIVRACIAELRRARSSLLSKR